MIITRRVGDVVRIREWDDMKAEYGLTPSGNIDTPRYAFTKPMREFCGRELVIRSCIGHGYKLKCAGVWNFPYEAIEHQEEILYDTVYIDEFLRESGG